MHPNILRVANKDYDKQRSDIYYGIDFGYTAMSNTSRIMGYLKFVADRLRAIKNSIMDIFPNILGPGNIKLIKNIKSKTKDRKRLEKMSTYFDISPRLINVIEGQTVDLKTLVTTLHGILSYDTFSPGQYLDMLTEAIGDLSNRPEEAHAFIGKYQSSITMLQKINKESSGEISKLFEGKDDQMSIGKLIPNYSTLSETLPILDSLTYHLEIDNIQELKSKSDEINQLTDIMLKLYNESSITLSSNSAEYIISLTDVVIDRLGIYNDLIYVLLRTCEITDKLITEIYEY